MTEQNGPETSRPAKPLGARIREKVAYPVVYMFLVTLAFTLVLVGVSRATRARVESNTQIMFERAVLMAVLPDEVDASTPSPEVHTLFTDRIAPLEEGTGGAYKLMESDEVTAYALPFEGQGFWDIIKGVIGIDTDKESIVGIAFYEQKETPGLGAEIIKPYFCERFIGRKMAQGDTALDVISATQEITGENEVQAITGATQTSTRLEKILNRTLSTWREALPDAKGGRP